MQAIFTRPKFDEASNFSFLWMERLINTVKDKLESYVDLPADEATRKNVEKALYQNPEADFCYYDHGSSSGLAAQGGMEYCIDDGNVELLKGRICYSMACLWLSGNGAKAYTAGAKVVVGYVKEFAFTVEDEMLFCTAANSGYIAHVEGERDWAKVKAVMIEAFNKAISETDNPWSKTWLTWNRDNLRIYAPGVDVPETKCIFRKVAIWLLGPRLGWRISRTHAMGWMLHLIGYGITVHAVASELYHKGGYAEILKPQGEWIGLGLILIGFIFLVQEHVKLLGKLIGSGVSK